MQKLSMAAGVAMIILLAVLIVWQADILGVPEGKLEQDARKAQQVEDSWEVVRDINGDMCAMLFYDNARRSCTYSIYLTRNGMSYGYFFGQGGLDAYMVEGVKGLKFEDKGIALLSLNRDKVCKVVVDNGGLDETITVNPDEPFAIVLPADCGEITIYDEEGDIVTLNDTYTGI